MKRWMWPTLAVVNLCLAAIAGWVGGRLAVTSVSPSLHATSTVGEIKNFPVGFRPLASLTPPNLVARRLSPVALIERLGIVKSGDPLFLERMTMGSAVAVTSDGWFVTTLSTLNKVRVSDLSLSWNGQVYPIIRAVRDTTTDAIFLQVAASGMPAASFERAESVSSGAGMWLEPRPRILYPVMTVDVRLLDATTPLSSERAGRRFLVAGADQDGALGAPLWDEDGQLVGLIEAKTSGGWRVVPAGDLSSALSSLLATGEIRHASLGVRGFDLVHVAFVGVRALPRAGSWLRPDRHLGLPAVTGNGAAAGSLQDGDVIERVERDILDGGADLGERLLDYSPGSSVILYGERSGQPFEKKIQLGSVRTGEILK